MGYTLLLVIHMIQMVADNGTMGIVHVVLCACTCGLDGSPPQGSVWAIIHLYIFSFPGARSYNANTNFVISTGMRECASQHAISALYPGLCKKIGKGPGHTWQQSWMCRVSGLDVGSVHMGTTQACQGLPPVLLGRDLLHRHHQQLVNAIPLDGGVGWEKQSS